MKCDEHDEREILNLLLKTSITTTDEPPRDSNSINSFNIHNNSNKSSAVNITNDDRGVNVNSVKEKNRIKTNKRESSNGNSNSNKSGRWDGNANKKSHLKMSVKIVKPNGIKVQVFFEKKLLCRHGKNYYYFWKSNILVINLIVDFRNMIKVSKNMSL